MDRKFKGASSELIACAWLLKQGYEVFRNVSPHGEIDVIGIKDGEIYFFDVKTAYFLSTGEYGANRLSAEQIARGVKIIRVGDDDCHIMSAAAPESKIRACENCSKDFFARNSTYRFCSAACKNVASLKITGGRTRHNAMASKWRAATGARVVGKRAGANGVSSDTLPVQCPAITP